MCLLGQTVHAVFSAHASFCQTQIVMSGMTNCLTVRLFWLSIHGGRRCFNHLPHLHNCFIRIGTGQSQLCTWRIWIKFIWWVFKPLFSYFLHPRAKSLGKKPPLQRYVLTRPMYVDIRRPCMDSNNLMQSISYTTEAWSKIYMTEIVYRNSYSEVWDDGFLIHRKIS